MLTRIALFALLAFCGGLLTNEARHAISAERRAKAKGATPEGKADLTRIAAQRVRDRLLVLNHGKPFEGWTDFDKTAYRNAEAILGPDN